MESIQCEIPGSSKKSHEAQLQLALIREQYLQAKPPQQIEELKDLFQKYVQDKGKGAMASAITSEKDQVGSSIRERSAGLETATAHAEDEMRRDEDLDGVGNKTKELKGDSTSIKDWESDSCKKRNIIGRLSTDQIPIVIGNLYDSTLGHSQPPLAAAGLEKGDLDGSQSFLQPPIQYRIAFAKHIIKQLESANWSGPQGSHEKDVEDPVDQETLLQSWYEGLELLSRSGQALSEPFYRLYEIKVAHDYSNRENGGGEMVKIFENETSFVANGTTGLVTWKASTEFLKWLSSEGVRKESGTLLTRLDGKKGPTRWIIELGCGSGLLAIALTRFMPSTLEQYIATDGSIVALENAKLNMDANFKNSKDKLLKNKIRFERVEWENDATSESFSQLVDGMTTIYGCENGILLGADIVFDPGLIPDLVNLVQQFLDAKAGRIVISSTIRSESTMKLFKVELGIRDLAIKKCGAWDDGEILEISLKNNP